MASVMEAAQVCAVASLVEASQIELEAGDLHGAWQTAQRALERWLRDRYLERTGKLGSTITTAEGLVCKLRGAKAIDRWTWTYINHLRKGPQDPRRCHVEAVLRFVTETPSVEALR